MNWRKIRPNWKTLIQIPRRASGHFDQNLSVLDVGHVFPTRQRLTETAVRCGARVHPPPETPLQDVVGSAVAAPPNARTQIPCHFGCVNGMRGLAGCMHALFIRWSVMVKKKVLGCIISQPTIIVSQRFGDPKMSPAARCCHTLIATLKDRSLLF